MKALNLICKSLTSPSIKRSHPVRVNRMHVRVQTYLKVQFLG